MFSWRVRDINELTNFDMVMIKSTIDVIYNEEFNCSKCVKRISEELREIRKGCTGKFPFERKAIPGVNYTKCPGNFYSTSHAMLLDIHRLHRKGVMASEGGLLDQSSKYIDAMNFLEVLVSEKETEQMKKRLNDGRKQSRGRNHLRGKSGA